MTCKRTSLLDLHDPESEPEGFNYDKSILIANDQANLTKFLGSEKQEGGEGCRRSTS
jgi:hypothetical protein